MNINTLCNGLVIAIASSRIISAEPRPVRPKDLERDWLLLQIQIQAGGLNRDGGKEHKVKALDC